MENFSLFMVKAIVAHLIFLYSIFDIYFTSPLTHGMPHHSTSNISPPSKRLVLFVADGLRADKCFETEYGQPVTPFLREKALTDGQWAVSHTRVPTESRPGHVAIIAGFYEDVSAITKGWKENPVEFDSVFNQSYRTYSWGSPDIVPMFSRGLAANKVITHSYPAEYEDFAGSDLSSLDTWVFDKVTGFFSDASTNATLSSELQKSQTVYFLHLLGIDTNGHRHNPSSVEYMNNIRLVDAGIRNMTDLIENYYADNLTTYIVTSDHGMSEWGTHGSGHPHETLTPLIVWGAGVSRSQYNNWSVDEGSHVDVNQADIAALLSSFIGINYPVNSVGILNTDFLSVSDLDKAEMMYTNMLAIIEQFLSSLKVREETTFSVLFRSYQHLSASQAADYKRQARVLIQSHKYTECITLCKNVMLTALNGVEYYHSYDRFYLELCITVGFFSWILYALIFYKQVSDPARSVSSDYNHNRNSNLTWWFVRAIIVSALLIQRLPWTHIIYCLTPTFILQPVFSQYHYLTQFIKSSEHSRYTILELVFILVCLELMVLGFFYRWSLSIIMLLIPLYHCYKLHLNKTSTSNRFIVMCVLLSIFPILPVVGRGTTYSLVFTAGLSVIIYLLYYCRDQTLTHITKNRVDIFILVSAVVNKFMVTQSIYLDYGLPVISQIISWSILGISLILPLFSFKEMRLKSVSLSLFTIYLLLSTSYESWFFICLVGFVFSWVQSTQQNQNSELYRSFIYLLLITFAFFATGNIASINSFEPASVYCFLTLFKPFSMAILLLLKIIIPIILVSCSYEVILKLTNSSDNKSFIIILILSDLLGLHFFMLIKDHGSWLEIGTSISHYVICLSTTIVSLLLHQLTKLYMNCSFIKQSHESFE